MALTRLSDGLFAGARTAARVGWQGGLRDRPARRPTRETIGPLVNIVFLLLIFFLLAGTLRSPEALEVDPPVAGSGVAPKPTAPTLMLDREGALALDGRQLVAGELSSALLAAAGAPSANSRVRLLADRRARAEQLLPLLESLAELGFDEVTLVTRAVP